MLFYYLGSYHLTLPLTLIKLKISDDTSIDEGVMYKNMFEYNKRYFCSEVKILITSKHLQV